MNNTSQTFNIYVDLFNTGEFSEILIIPHNTKFAVLLEDKQLATIEKNKENNWVKVDGNMPGEKLKQIGNMINLKLGN